MNSVVEIDAGKDGKHVSLQERDQKFERGQRNRQRERYYASDPTDRAKRGAEQHNESGEYLERDVAGQHVGKQTHAV